MRPVVNGLKQKSSSQIRFADLDFNAKNNQALIEQFRVVGHPSFVMVDGQGKLVKDWLGVIPGDDLESVLKQTVKS
jgi:thioredoxin-related protein